MDFNEDMIKQNRLKQTLLNNLRLQMATPLDSDYILLIMSCVRYKSKAFMQKKTWLLNLPPTLLYFHVIGDEKLQEPFDFNHTSRILRVKTPDDYNSLPKKVIAALAAVHATFQYKIVFKTDDDQMLQQPTFFQTLTSPVSVTHNRHYGGFPLTVRTHTSTFYTLHPELPQHLVLEATTYCLGRFYFLSCKAIEHLLTKRDAIEERYIEDHAIGYYLSDFPEKTPIVRINSLTIFKDMP